MFSVKLNSKFLNRFLHNAISYLVISILVCTLFLTKEAGATDDLILALSARHLQTNSENITKLEKLAGGPEKFVERLLELRLTSEVPFVPIRAERILLSYADRQVVLDALLEDISHADRAGLARAIAVYIDSVPGGTPREQLARAVSERGRYNKEFLPYLQVLTESKDENVRQIANAALQ
jgi:hypothetical protein